jgi:preprotein translocase subunit SecE
MWSGGVVAGRQVVTAMAAMQNNQARAGSLWGEMLSFSLYKWGQGRVTRQVTFAALALIVSLGAWQLSQFIAGLVSGEATGPDLGAVRFALPLALLAAGLWLCFRIVNIPRFAEFLIAVEAEMAKVSWPTTTEVFRSSAVVIFLIFALAFLLAAFDLFWGVLLHPAKLWALFSGGAAGL